MQTNRNSYSEMHEKTLSTISISGGGEWGGQIRDLVQY